MYYTINTCHLLWVASEHLVQETARQLDPDGTPSRERARTIRKQVCKSYRRVLCQTGFVVTAVLPLYLLPPHGSVLFSNEHQGVDQYHPLNAETDLLSVFLE